MARVKDTAVEAVKQAADIVTVVESRVRLRKVGARYVGLCPFHQERTPSFSVMPARGRFHCFGCGEDGDAIAFVEKSEQLDFVGALEWLADRFNVPLEYEELSPEVATRRKRQERLYAVLERATTFYERYLWDSRAGEPVREYLGERGLLEPACREFRLGLAPADGRLVATARDSGFTLEELRGAGLVNRGGGDYFRERLLFPLADARGRVVGFSARKLREDDPLQGKYVNSPEGELFHKSAILYGLHLARGAIAKQDRAIVVEGQTDTLALRQLGLEPVVASMGTALTERQLKELGRLTRRLYLCFDSDSAGEAATLRGMQLARQADFDVRVVALPKGSDPADDPNGFESRLGEAASYPLHGVRVVCARPGTAQEKFVAARKFLEPIEDSPERQEAVRYLADQLDLPRETQAGLAPAGRAAVGAVTPKLLEAGERLERNALAACLAHPELLKLLAELSPEHFDGAENRRLQAQLVSSEPALPELEPALAELDVRAEEEALDEPAGRELLLRLRERRVERELRAGPSPERVKELQATLVRIQAARTAVA